MACLHPGLKRYNRPVCAWHWCIARRVFLAIFAQIGELLRSFSQLSFLGPDNLFSLLVTQSQDSPWIASSIIWFVSLCDSRSKTHQFCVFETFQFPKVFRLEINIHIGYRRRPEEVFAAQRFEFFLTSQKLAIHLKVEVVLCLDPRYLLISIHFIILSLTIIGWNLVWRW